MARGLFFFFVKKPFPKISRLTQVRVVTVCVEQELIAVLSMQAFQKFAKLHIHKYSRIYRFK